MNIHWKDWCWSWSSNTLATWFEELTQWKRPWCWKRLRAGGEGDNRGWDGWVALSTQWIWVWANSGRWWRAGKAGVLQSMGHKESDTTQQLNNNKWIISNKQERTEVTPKSQKLYFLYKLHILSCVCGVLCSWLSLFWDPDSKQSLSGTLLALGGFSLAAK